MNPDTADYLNDREETANFQYSSQVETKTNEILEDLDLMNDALGEFGCEFGMTGLSMIIIRSQKAVSSQYNMTQVVDELNLHSRSIAEWYAKRMIKRDELYQTPNFLRHQAD